MKMKVVESDLSGTRIEDPKEMATIFVVYSDGRRGVFELDVTLEEAGDLARRGRKVSREKTRVNGS